jgi:hypothetical protein
MQFFSYFSYLSFFLIYIHFKNLLSSNINIIQELKTQPFTKSIIFIFISFILLFLYRGYMYKLNTPLLSRLIINVIIIYEVFNSFWLLFFKHQYIKIVEKINKFHPFLLKINNLLYIIYFLTMLFVV